MKFNKVFNRLLLLVAMVIFSVGISNAQAKSDIKQDKKAALRQLIESRNFAFVAQSATPMGGRFINLNTLYDVRVSGDTVMSDLPYFGRAFVAPMYPTESALRFTSTEFNYDIKERKKGRWDITISPKDGKDVRQMQMSVFDNGTATLQVMSNNRQPITFNGFVKENKRK